VLCGAGWRGGEEVRRSDCESLREAGDDAECRVAGAPLDIADIGAVKIRCGGETLLRPPPAQAKAAYIPTK